MNRINSPQQKAIRFRARSFVAFVLSPEAPVADWLRNLDSWTQNSPGFFLGRPVVLDCSILKPTPAEIAQVVAQLLERGIRILAIEHPDFDQLGNDLPPILSGARSFEATPKPAVEKAPAEAVAEAPPEPAPSNALIIDEPIRSGQTVVHPHGDIIVLGSVGSGSDVVAGGSIHIYGTLRGRAMAGAMGNPNTRIFCRRNEAELLGIDGHYRTADDMDLNSRGKPVQSYLDNGVLHIASLD